MMLENDAIARIGALFVALGAVAMVLGRRAARSKNGRRHRNLMIGAVAAHAAFLAVFIWRFVVYGFTQFEATGAVRWVYLVVFFTHEPVAVVSVPLVVAAAVLGLAGQLDLHRQLAPLAYAAWLYASLTGIALYVLLYA